jgi:hypothetical protein
MINPSVHDHEQNKATPIATAQLCQQLTAGIAWILPSVLSKEMM